MMSSLTTVLPLIQDLEYEYGSVAKVPADDERLIVIRDNLDTEESTNPSLAEINRYLMETNQTLKEAGFHFDVAGNTLGNIYRAAGVEVPHLYTHELIKGEKVYYARTLYEISDFLKASVSLVNYMKRSGKLLHGWLICPCQKISLNIPKELLLSEILKKEKVIV
ncbi:hypothetical protein MOO45_02785 [Bombilactobacillus folatiphilus]|uniref:Uncharacterized protein n=1 Tax=Bombilactobacillus folatiphilus TaxID=2923362 RepID=A0ABY4PAM6_9LACO|nr:hypothetical protein [Bombilactobacillus folatiphilus]UQS82591.1 hypothetical protein MOO45_02785 [Bombilactobacillus folatiphilus]